MDFAALFSQYALIATPAVTAGAVFLVVKLIKRLQSIKFSDNKKPILRAFAGVLSFGGVIALSLATGVDVSDAQVQEFVSMLLQIGLAYFGATGIHDNLGKQA